MTGESKEIVKNLLAGIREPKVVQQLCAHDVTYVSLNYSNSDLHKIMPWCGTGHGAEAISKTFHDVAEFWTVESFTSEDILGEGDKVAVFGRFTYTSTKLHKTVTTPFAILCKLKAGKVSYMQFMEDNVLYCLQFSVGRNVEVPERSQWG